MPKGVKIALIVLVPLALAVGVLYGLAKVGALPTQKWAQKSPVAAKLLKLAKLDKPGLPARTGALPEPKPDPLAGEKKALEGQREALKQERDSWEAAKRQSETASASAAIRARAQAPDPASVARMASVYEQMDAAQSGPIFQRLPDPQVVALMRAMDEAKVAEILTAFKPERAARLTLELSRPAPVQSASAR